MANGIAINPLHWNWTLNAGFLAPLGIAIAGIGILIYIHNFKNARDPQAVLKLSAAFIIPGTIMTIIGWIL